MKPTNFEFARATGLAEAATILRQAAGSARAVAGGQSLGPMLNLRLVQPSILVDITAIPELTHIEEDAGGVTVGACVTTSDIEDGRVRMEELPILATVAGGVAYRAVRNRGTIGGSICHADPAGDWLPTELRLTGLTSDGNRVYELTQTASEVVSLAQVNPAIFSDRRIPVSLTKSEAAKTQHPETQKPETATAAVAKTPAKPSQEANAYAPPATGSLKGAQPVVPSGSFDGRWAGLQ